MRSNECEAAVGRRRTYLPVAPQLTVICGVSLDDQEFDDIMRYAKNILEINFGTAMPCLAKKSNNPAEEYSEKVVVSRFGGGLTSCFCQRR